MLSSLGYGGLIVLRGKRFIKLIYIMVVTLSYMLIIVYQVLNGVLAGRPDL